MNLKELIREVESIAIDMVKYHKDKLSVEDFLENRGKLEGIKKTVEAVDKWAIFRTQCEPQRDWQKLKRLLDIR